THRFEAEGFIQVLCDLVLPVYVHETVVFPGDQMPCRERRESAPGVASSPELTRRVDRVDPDPAGRRHRGAGQAYSHAVVFQHEDGALGDLPAGELMQLLVRRSLMGKGLGEK